MRQIENVIRNLLYLGIISWLSTSSFIYKITLKDTRPPQTCVVKRAVQVYQNTTRMLLSWTPNLELSFVVVSILKTMTVHSQHS